MTKHNAVVPFSQYHRIHPQLTFLIVPSVQKPRILIQKSKGCRDREAESSSAFSDKSLPRPSKTFEPCVHAIKAKGR